LKEEGSLLGQRLHKSRLRSHLISLQIAICTILLIGAGLLVRGLMNLNSLDAGFQTKNVYLTSLDLRLQNYDDTRAAAFYRELLTRIDAEPGVQSALVSPLRGVRRTGAAPEDRPIPDRLPETNFNNVSGNYFDVMGIRLSQGRTFTAAEMTRGDAVAVVSQAMANAWWNGQSALGKRFRYGIKGEHSAEVIGVAADVRSIHISAPDGPLFYLPANPTEPLSLAVATRTAASTPLSATIQRVVRELDPDVLVSVRTIEENLDRETSPMRLGSALALLLGGLALALASVGIYGVMAYAVSQRTREIGIRMALGAERSSVLRWMLAQSMRPVFVGMAIGIVLAAAVSVASSKLLLGVGPLDPLAYLAVSLFLALVALLASYLPARRATRVDPMIALRYE
jgi:putative ABC transport system permease protein